jgi:biopolymer transport protein ExbB
VYEYFVKGGPVMWPLLLCSVVSLAVTLERLGAFWQRARRRRPAVVERMLALASQGRFDEALAAGRESRDPLAATLADGLAHREYGLSDAIATAAQEEIGRARRGLGVLDTIITVAPLLGILGTVTGIIGAFDMLGQRGAPDPKVVTSGIAEALITTAAGLIIAIASLLPYNYFMSRVQRLTRGFEHAGTQLEVAVRRGQERANAPK